ncbi:MAG: DUF1838 domain-containing protein [Candidatus Cloacimonetes bacterium]|nr:DUF1838 domain-containing protein [Candidatus Cloacimonadota bacterium]
MNSQICLIILLCLMPMLLLSVDLSNPSDYMNAFMRVRAALPTKKRYITGRGRSIAISPAKKRMELFDFEGYSIARTVVEEGGFKLLTREAAFFKDHRTGEILENWRNPFTGATVPVIHIFNESGESGYGLWRGVFAYVHRILPSTELGETLVFHMDIFPYYPSPLNTREHGEFVGSDTYQAAEFFQFFVDKKDLLNEELDSVPANISWSRISPGCPLCAWRIGRETWSLCVVDASSMVDLRLCRLTSKLISENVNRNTLPLPPSGANRMKPAGLILKKLFDQAQAERNER